MTEKHIFADVSLPFHVWIKEGRRWVLRDASAQLGNEASSPEEPPTSPGRRADRPSRH
jgi:hypothetical protein